MRSLSALLHQPQPIVLCTCQAHTHDLGPAVGRQCQTHSPHRRTSAANSRDMRTDGLSCQTWRTSPSRSLCRSMTMSEQQSVSDPGRTHSSQTTTQRVLLLRYAGWCMGLQLIAKKAHKRRPPREHCGSAARGPGTPASAATETCCRRDRAPVPATHSNTSSRPRASTGQWRMAPCRCCGRRSGSSSHSDTAPAVLRCTRWS